MQRLFTLLFCLFLSLPSTAENRIALVIGNADYPVGALKNPTHDANDIAQKLTSFGFSVTKLLNADQKSMKQAIRTFSKKLSKEDNSVGLFYFAGHGIQVEGLNYLVPIGANIEIESEVEYEAIDAGRVLSGMERAGNGLNMVILDACRDNPFARSFRSNSRGLARMGAPKGSVVLYATSPGDVAQDGKGRNGIFTQHLLTAMNEPGRNIEQIFKQTAIAVSRATNKKQVPWTEGVILGDFYFQNRPPQKTIPALEPKTDPSQPNNDALFWSTIDHQDAQQLSLYIKQFPAGQFVGIAQIKLAKLQQPTQVTLTIRSNVTGDNVIINGKAYGPTRLDVLLEKGQHVITVEKAGYQPFSKTLELTTATTIKAQLNPISTPKPIPSSPPTLRTAQLKVPNIAQNGAIIPVSAKGNLPNKILLRNTDNCDYFNVTNISPFQLTQFSTRIKLAKTDTISLYSLGQDNMTVLNKKTIKVTKSGMDGIATKVSQRSCSVKTQLRSQKLNRAFLSMIPKAKSNKNPTLKMRVKRKNNALTVKTLIKHPMETGKRKDRRTGKTIPRHAIIGLAILGDNTPLTYIRTSPLISKNPYFSVTLSDAAHHFQHITVKWVDNLGNSGSLSAKIK